MEYEGLSLEVFSDVYEPAEDSFLLAKYAKELAGGLRNAKRKAGNGPRILDMGCGCGIQALVCARADAGNEVVGADLNPLAVENSRLNAGRNGLANAKFVESDLFSAISGKFDAVIFNPPYLPTSEDERVRGKLNLAFDGGESGRNVTGRFLRQFPAFLEKEGALLMIESSLAGIGKTVKGLEKAGFRAEVLEEEKFFFERIAAIRAERL